jgi:hypothetical protein
MSEPYMVGALHVLVRRSEAYASRTAHRLEHPAASFGVALLVYVTTLWLLLPRNVDPFSASHFLGIGSDPTLFTWAMGWWPYALTHGLNPFITHVVWAPQGFNLTWDTSVPSVALLFWPVTAMAGPVVAYNAAIMASPVLAALASFGLCRELTHRTGPALVGGWLFGFGPYESGQLLGHLHLTFIWPVPLLAWLAVRLWRQTMGARSYIVLSALTLAFLVGVSTEVYVTFTLMAAATLALIWVWMPTERRTLAPIVRSGLLAYGGSLILCIPFLYYLLTGLTAVPAALNSPLTYSADILNFVLPTPITVLGGTAALPITSHFTANLTENGAYIGIPLLLVLGWWIWRGRRQRWVQMGALLGLGCLICELGPQLHIRGSVGGHLPWVILTKLPLLRDILPVRLSMYFDLIVGVVATELLCRLARTRRLALVLSAGILVLAWWPAPLRSTRVQVPALLTARQVRAEFPRDTTLVVLPYGEYGQSMIWQAADEMYFSMAGGYLSFVPKDFAKLPIVSQLYGAAAPGGHFEAALEAFCKSHRVAAVVATAGTPPRLAQRLAHMHWKVTSRRGASIFWVPTARS